MIDIKEKSKCNGCHACYNICPKSCIEMKYDEEGFKYPFINIDYCINCNLCEKACPELNGKTENKNANQLAYAAYNINITERLESSSGGIFTLIAKQILQENGVVFGASLNDNCREVNHIAIYKESELCKLRGSKYIQSNINHTYQLVKEELNKAKKVLFSGTPCQIGGLLSFLGQHYDNLYTQDLICHGVPSHLAWDKYLKYHESISNSLVEKVDFRNKKYGWEEYSVFIKFKNGTGVYSKNSEDLFINGFVQNYYLRPSCYSCLYKTKSRQSDITLADFWGASEVSSKMYDDMGISLVWIHTKKGMELFENIKLNIKAEEIDINKALIYNPSAIINLKIPEQRFTFFKKINNYNFDDLMNKLNKKTFKNKIKNVLKKIKDRLLRCEGK